MHGSEQTRHTAAGPAAGYIFQIERALEHLADAPSAGKVAVEHLDDVIILNGEKVVLRDQNKHSIDEQKEILTDRSWALWRTLQIWLGDGARFCQKYVITTNRPVTTALARKLKTAATANHNERLDIVRALRSAGKASSRRSSAIQTVIDDVLSHDDAELGTLISRIEIVECTSDSESARRELAAKFAIDTSTVDADIILDSLLGWVVRRLIDHWRKGEPGIIARATCVKQCRAIERSQFRRRLLPRPSSEIPVPESEREGALGRPFVEHLTRINLAREEILEAIESFIRFSTEKHRLADAGEVPDQEWVDRGNRLIDRWQQVFRRCSRAGGANIGIRIFEETTYQHYEPLAGEACHERYMTSGRYHRLADDDDVWWDPEYVKGSQS